MEKMIRVAAAPVSLDILLRGQLRFLNGHYEVIGVASPDGAMHRKIREREGIRTVELRIERKISPVRDLRSLIALYRLFRTEKPAIVHSLTPKAGLLSMTAARMARVPVRIHTFTGLIFPWRKGAMSRLLKTADRLICRMATHVIPEGNGVKQDLSDHRITKKPLNVLADGNINGVDTEYFKPVPSAGGDGVTRFVFVGRIVRDKGIEELRTAFERLDTAELVLVGPLEEELDPLSESCRKWVGSGKGVTHTGFQDDIRPFLSAADVLVLPSHREGFPNTPLQAGAMALPCIATDICGCNEIVVDGETGLLVEPRNAESLHAAMKLLATDPELRRRMGENARKRIVEKFPRQKVWDAHLNFYKNVQEVCQTSV